MSTLPKPFLTPQQYLAIERAAERKSEYLDGEMFLMAGASNAHVIITDNLTFSFRSQLAGKPCLSYSSDLRLWILASRIYTYPDLMVVCGPEQRSPDDPDSSLTNPTVIVEVLSPSTEADDRGRKFRHYQKIPTLREYVLVSQDEILVDRLTLQPGADPTLHAYQSPDDTLELPSVGCSIPLRDIYAKTELTS